MRAHGNDPARSFKYFNKSLLSYLNVCDFGSSAIVELQYARLLSEEAGEDSAFIITVVGNLRYGTSEVPV